MRIEFKEPIPIKSGETCEITMTLNPDRTEVKSCHCKITSPPEDHRPLLRAEFDVEAKLVPEPPKRMAAARTIVAPIVGWQCWSDWLSYLNPEAVAKRNRDYWMRAAEDFNRAFDGLPLSEPYSEEESPMDHAYSGALATKACCAPTYNPNREHVWEVWIITKDRVVALHEYVVAKSDEDARFRAGVFDWLTASGKQPSDVNIHVCMCFPVEVTNG
jgi:hypothetical protein